MDMHELRWKALDWAMMSRSHIDAHDADDIIRRAREFEAYVLGKDGSGEGVAAAANSFSVDLEVGTGEAVPSVEIQWFSPREPGSWSATPETPPSQTLPASPTFDPQKEQN